ncbi:Ubiquitin carboxyl-terminal hydrolase 10 [Candida viswanathii]|uniref:ubiquitinyl hydrolase 1 n=1 Tax=Candida viswanathii TaxID=5486 RepID=A0A367XZF5_9ASCO|nr:Ubiquitin carboxyl-terminal hydrolase 10 [Candida viswanathii]
MYNTTNTSKRTSASPASASSAFNNTPATALNPILLANPLVFKPASSSSSSNKNLTNENHIPSSYIILSSMKKSKTARNNASSSPSANPNTTTLSGVTPAKANTATNRPKSLNEAIAKYTGNRYLTHKERKRKRKLDEVSSVHKKSRKEDVEEVKEDVDDDSDDEGEDIEEGYEEEEEQVQEPVTKKSKGMWGAIKSFLSGTPTPSVSTDDDLGEDLGEDIGISESSEQSPDADEEDSKRSPEAEEESSPGEVYAETSPFTGFSEPEKSEDIEDDEDEEEDDADFTAQSDSDEEEEDDEDDDSASTSVQASDDDDLEKLKHDLKVDQLVNAKGENDEDDDDEEEEEVKTGLEETENRSSTPPTSPEEEEEREAKQQQRQQQQQVQAREVDYYDINENYDDRGSNGSDRIYKNWRELTKNKPPVGLLNHGVTCYMNSAIQALLHIPAVQHYLNDVNDKKVNDLKPRSITHVLAELSRRMWMGDRKYINPKKIIQRLDEINCMMSEWQQEDSHEYYMSLMSRLQEDSTPKGKKLNESIIYDIFGGLLKQRITCHKCHNVSVTNQEFYDLSLGLNRRKFKNSNKFSVEKSINEFFSNELIKKTEENKSGYYCDNCKIFTHANKISTIQTAPETLTIHFKRFKFNNNSSSKVKQLINYSKFLDLSKYMEDKEEKAVYKLISVIVHEGRSISSGHYVSHCLQPDGYTWSTYDDEYINKIEERVALNDPSAYVLVYTKLTPKDADEEEDEDEEAA